MCTSLQCGLCVSRICVDVGLGFGKWLVDNAGVAAAEQFYKYARPWQGTVDDVVLLFSRTRSATSTAQSRAVWTRTCALQANHPSPTPARQRRLAVGSRSSVVSCLVSVYCVRRGFVRPV